MGSLKGRKIIKMKRIILITIVGILTTTGLYAQKAYKLADTRSDGSTRVVLDMSVVAGMPEGAVTTTKKTWPLDTETPANSGSYLTGNREGEVINATVYHKLEIAPADLNSSGEIEVGGMSAPKDWATAFTKCKESTYDSGNGSWRLPTMRELQMIWIFKTPLENLGVGDFGSSSYWVATEYNATGAWSVSVSNGGTYYGSFITKTTTYRVRCVRELP